MTYFYFDTGLHRFLSKQHNSPDQQRQVDNLILSLSNISGIDLYSGCKPVWAPGLYLERVHLGKKLFKHIVEKANHIKLTGLLNKNQVDDIFTHIRDEVDKIVDTILKKHLPLPCVPSNMIGYMGGMLVEDLNGRYSDEEKELLVSICLKAEATQQILLSKLKGTTEEKKSFQKIVFHTSIKGFFQEYFLLKNDINLSRLMLTYSSIAKGIEKNSNSDHNGGKRLIDPHKDIADGELIHFPIFGTWVNGELVPVNGITFDFPGVTRNRLRTLKSLSVWVMANLQCDMQLRYGRAFCVNRLSHEITSIDVKELEIESWVYDDCSEEALSILQANESNRT